MWRTYSEYDSGSSYGDIDRLDIINGSQGFRVNPYTQSKGIMMSALANTPLDWWAGSSDDTDAVLDHKKNEHIGCNHKNGRNWYAHVVFADGHTEKMRIPVSTTGAELTEITEWLCTGVSVGFNGQKYEKLTE